MSTQNGGIDGQLLRKLRKKLGLHQHQVAALLKDFANEKAGINQGRISEWENGEPIPPRRQAELKVILKWDGRSEKPS